jgi:hypothetical protein
MKTKQYTYTDYLCEDCEEELHTKQGEPYVEKDGNFYCYGCAVKRKIISTKEWLRVVRNMYDKEPLP